VIKIDLGAIQPSLAGPFRPNERVAIPNLKPDFEAHLTRSLQARGFGLSKDAEKPAVPVIINGENVILTHGSLLIAAITSCTNTSNPSVMLSAGLLAKKALAHGLQVNPTVKCSLMPGSQVVSAYLERAGLLAPLAGLGFNLVGYGCGSCIGNSGPLKPEVAAAVRNSKLVTASILSGNRNFEGRIHALSRANYLASPPLVVAYALAGTVDIDLSTEPLGISHDGNPIFLQDLLPSEEEIKDLMQKIQPGLYRHIYTDLFTGDARWDSIIPGKPSPLFDWNSSSTYIKEPPYFQGLQVSSNPPRIADIHGARVLALLGDSVTTDHISPAGTIPPESPAGRYLIRLGVQEKDFNSYGSRRGNDEVMARGTFANIRLHNRLTPNIEGGVTRVLPESEVMPIYDAAQIYKQQGTPLIIIAGKEYGTGSSRDWAAKGPLLLGVRAVIAESFERIHRSNLIGMGILPLQFQEGQNAGSLGLTGEEVFSISGLPGLTPKKRCQVQAETSHGNVTIFEVTARVDTTAELARVRMGGILTEALLENWH
jgi:aconitate hydratase